jgi:hypothetical protein
MKLPVLLAFFVSGVAFANPPKPSHSGEFPWDKPLADFRDTDFSYKFINNDKVVTDKFTNWMWQVKPSENMIWYDAYSYCENSNYAGFSDWQLPTYWQLQSIVDHSRSGQHIYSAFSGVKSEHTLWTRDDSIAIDQPDHDDRFAHFVEIGLTTFEVRDQKFNALCVRGEVAPPAPLTQNRFAEVKPDLILDARAGLYWTSVRNPKVSKTLLFTGPTTFNDAYNYCTNLTFAGMSNWRLPSVQELKTLIRLDVRYPSSGMPKFPATMYSVWSSSTTDVPSLVWRVNSIGEVLRTNDVVAVFGCVHEQ